MVDDLDVHDALDDKQQHDEHELLVLDDDEHEPVLNDIFELIDAQHLHIFDEIDEHDIVEYVM